jgi:hypothetical protein
MQEKLIAPRNIFSNKALQKTRLRIVMYVTDKTEIPSDFNSSQKMQPTLSLHPACCSRADGISHHISIRPLLLVTTVMAIALSCAPQQGPPFINSETSSCGGFTSAKREMLMPVVVDTAHYCTAERLYWSFSEVAGIVHLMLTRVIADCTMKPVFSGTADSWTIALTEKVTPDTTGAAYCRCAFDSYAEVTGFTGGTIDITLDGAVYSINLADGEGSLIINSVPATSSCPR